MSRREERPLAHVTIRIFREDHEFLKSAFDGTVGYNRVVRHMIHKLVKSLREQTATITDLDME